MRGWFFLCAGLAFSSVVLGDDAVHDTAVHYTNASGLPDRETAIWKKLKSSLFENRPMSGDALELVAPMRAEDGAAAFGRELNRRRDRRRVVVHDEVQAPDVALAA